MNYPLGYKYHFKLTNMVPSWQRIDFYQVGAIEHSTIYPNGQTISVTYPANTIKKLYYETTNIPDFGISFILSNKGINNMVLSFLNNFFRIYNNKNIQENELNL